jgi:pimeloyl-ACP methyl ester carboxylesterase
MMTSTELRPRGAEHRNAGGPPPKHISVRSGLFDVEYRESSSGVPLVILHDMAARFPWAPYMDDLAAGFRVIAPQMPGFGYSTGIEHIDDPIDAVVFLNDLLDELEIEQAHVLGHDLGAMFASELAALSSSRVLRLVLVSPLGLAADGAEMADLFAMDPAQIPALLWRDPQSEAAKAFASMPSSPEAVEEETILRARAYASASRFVWPFPERGLHKRAHRIGAPTMVIHGGSDGFVPRELSEAFVRRVRGAQLTTMPGAGHFPMLEQREAFVSAVREFLG